MSDEIQVVMARGGAAVSVARPRAVEAHPEVAEEQLAYARVLDAGMRGGLLALLATFGAYVSGALAPRVPLAELPRYWSMPVKQYLAAAGVESGWGWVKLIGHGDILNFAGIVFLSALTILCYLAVIPVLLRKKDVVYAALAVVEVLVLALAASGLLRAGGH